MDRSTTQISQVKGTHTYLELCFLAKKICFFNKGDLQGSKFLSTSLLQPVSEKNGAVTFCMRQI